MFQFTVIFLNHLPVTCCLMITVLAISAGYSICRSKVTACADATLQQQNVRVDVSGVSLSWSVTMDRNFINNVCLLCSSGVHLLFKVSKTEGVKHLDFYLLNKWITLFQFNTYCTTFTELLFQAHTLWAFRKNLTVLHQIPSNVIYNVWPEQP